MVMLGRMVVVLGTVVGVVLGCAGTAVAAEPGQPPAGKVLLGVGGTRNPPNEFRNLTGARHPIYSSYMAWGQGIGYSGEFDGGLDDAAASNYRMMFHISTRNGSGEAITPGGIAQGRGDRYLITMSRAINTSNQYVYVRPMAEMNGHWNIYCAFNADGSRRNAAHSTRSYRKAFARITMIMRGGSVATIDARLRDLGMPVLNTGRAQLPRSNRVAMVWNPQGEGAPNVAGNQPIDYFPGYSWVDYVANDLYSINFRANWRAQNSLYNRFTQRPFMVAEWAPWGTDDPAFVNAMFDWVATHRRTVALVYFNGSSSTTFALSRKTRSLRRYKAYATGARYQCAQCGSTTPA